MSYSRAFGGISLLLLLFVDRLSFSDAFLFVYKKGKCPSPGSMTNFDKSKFAGVWFGYKRFPSILEFGLDCSASVFGDAGDTVTVMNEGIRRLKIFGKYALLKRSSIEGFASVPDPSRSSELDVAFGGVNMGCNAPNYFIHDTDYTNYAVIFSCAELPGFNIQMAWILTRERGKKPSNLATLEKSLARAGVDVKQFQTVNQKNCNAP